MSPVLKLSSGSRASTSSEFCHIRPDQPRLVRNQQQQAQTWKEGELCDNTALCACPPVLAAHASSSNHQGSIWSWNLFHQQGIRRHPNTPCHAFQALCAPVSPASHAPSIKCDAPSPVPLIMLQERGAADWPG